MGEAAAYFQSLGLQSLGGWALSIRGAVFIAGKIIIVAAVGFAVALGYALSAPERLKLPEIHVEQAPDLSESGAKAGLDQYEIIARRNIFGALRSQTPVAASATPAQADLKMKLVGTN